MLFNLSSKNNTSICQQNVKKTTTLFYSQNNGSCVLVTHRQCMAPDAAGNTNPVTVISYSFVCLGLYIVQIDF